MDDNVSSHSHSRDVPFDSQLSERLRGFCAFHKVPDTPHERHPLQHCLDSAMSAMQSSSLLTQVDLLYRDETTELLDAILVDETIPMVYRSRTQAPWVVEESSAVTYRATILYETEDEAPTSLNFIQDAVRRWERDTQWEKKEGEGEKEEKENGQVESREAMNGIGKAQSGWCATEVAVSLGNREALKRMR